MKERSEFQFLLESFSSSSKVPAIPILRTSCSLFIPHCLPCLLEASVLDAEAIAVRELFN